MICKMVKAAFLEIGGGFFLEIRLDLLADTKEDTRAALPRVTSFIDYS